MLTREILKLKGSVLYTIAPEDSLVEAVASMVDNDIGSLVVMNHGRLTGMLTFREILKAVRDHGGELEGATVGEVMVRQPRTVGPDMDIDELRRAMIGSHARYVPVMDGTTLAGVLSFHDVAKAVLEERSFENRMMKAYIESAPAS